MNKLYGLYAAILILTLTMAVISMGTPPQTAQPASAATQSQEPPAQSLPQGLLLGLGDLETEPCLITEEKLWAGKMLIPCRRKRRPPTPCPFPLWGLPPALPKQCPGKKPSGRRVSGFMPPG